MTAQVLRLFAQEARTARALCLQAGELAQTLAKSPLEVAYKESDGKSPVTNADQQINALLMAGLKAAFPADGFCAEEDEHSHLHASRRDAARVWCIDPIDGTREYIAQSGQYAVMVGLSVAGLPRFGAVYEPALGQLFMGACSEAVGQSGAQQPGGSEGGWASCERHGRDAAIAASACNEAAKARLMVSRHQRNRALDVLCGALHVQTRLPLGSVGLKMSRLANGEAELYACVTNKIHEWDACGPAAILLGAGGQVSDLAGRPLRFNKPETCMSHGLLASNAKLHGAALAAVARAAHELPHLAKLRGDGAQLPLAWP